VHQTWTLEFIILLLAIPNSTLCKLFHWPWKLLKKVEVCVHTQVAPSLLWDTSTIISRTYCMLKAVLFFKMQINFEREPRRHFLTLLGYDPMELSKKVQLFLLTWDIHERNLNWKYNQKTKVFLLNYIEDTVLWNLQKCGSNYYLKKKSKAGISSVEPFVTHSDFCDRFMLGWKGFLMEVVNKLFFFIGIRLPHLTLHQAQAEMKVELMLKSWFKKCNFFPQA